MYSRCVTGTPRSGRTRGGRKHRYTLVSQDRVLCRCVDSQKHRLVLMQRFRLCRKTTDCVSSVTYFLPFYTSISKQYIEPRQEDVRMHLQHKHQELRLMKHYSALFTGSGTVMMIHSLCKDNRLKGLFHLEVKSTQIDSSAFLKATSEPLCKGGGTDTDTGTEATTYH